MSALLEPWLRDAICTKQRPADAIVQSIDVWLASAARPAAMSFAHPCVVRLA